ncbi:hypothetical protein N5T79_05145 [Aliarcobacter cryaerophilus]|uniref:hypothetical protein n=1 Tax=Aliarcobacter cryaerophilus TaxID=28198 RepID=UPI0021B6B585|nr:hypothetical protein [Aliarcobacter cryaerophilus]MCT7528523.1 hypothetical protein [Aliarcobacter cryaerophilus]
MLKIDNTRKKYNELITAIKKNGFTTYTILDYYNAVKNKDVANKFCIMRHDVDGNVENALKMALLENFLGIRATYYFRMKGNLFNADIIAKIAELGHEVGYHYEHLPDANGNIQKATEIFKSNLSKLRNIAKVNTACMHGRPFSKYDSRDFWKYYKLEDFDLVAEPYINIDYSDIYYFSDTGLSWNNTKFNIRDKVVSDKYYVVESTNELMELFKNKKIDKVALLTHTDNWVDEPLVWLYYNSLNTCVNYAKRFLKLVVN